MSGFFYLVRVSFAWMVLLLGAMIAYSAVFHKSVGWIVFLWMIAMVFVVASYVFVR